MINVSAILITRCKEYPKEIKLEGFGEVIIKTESPCVFQRYLEAEKAKNNIIYIQDDDAIIDYKELWKHYDGRLTNGITQHHFLYYKDTGATLVGWGCFFPKKMLQVFVKYVEKYGADFHLSREADRIFTYLNQPHNTIIMSHQDLEQTKDKMSFELQHYEWAKQAIEKCRLL